MPDAICQISRRALIIEALVAGRKATEGGETMINIVVIRHGAIHCLPLKVSRTN